MKMFTCAVCDLYVTCIKLDETLPSYLPRQVINSYVTVGDEMMLVAHPRLFGDHAARDPLPFRPKFIHHCPHLTKRQLFVEIHATVDLQKVLVMLTSPS